MAAMNSTPTHVEPRATLGSNELGLRIEIELDWWVQYEGTSAQLVEEGLIPSGFEWPKAATDKYWSANGFGFWLRRSRPFGHKGPMRSWLEMDNWFVRVEASDISHDLRIRRGLDRKMTALKAEFKRHTVEGRRAWSAEIDQRIAAESDRKFQAFKALIPGLVPVRRGRKNALEI